MKRLLVLILTFSYMVATTGTYINLHFCMGELSDWSLWSSENQSTCGSCGMEKEASTTSGCCSDAHKWVKIQDDQKTSVTNFQFAHIHISEPLPLYGVENFSVFSRDNILLPDNHAPPRSGSIALYKRNSVFRI